LKNRREVSASEAALIRRNELAHGLIGRAPFFLIVTPEKGYLWGPLATLELEAPPDAEFNSNDALRQYLTNSFQRPLHTGTELELAVIRWLSDLAGGMHTLGSSAEDAFNRVGLLKAIQGGALHSGARLR
jgi:hypothetical protein